MEDPSVTVTFDSNNIALIRMCNDQNRMNMKFFEDFNKALDKVISKDDAIGLITTGDGKYFSNGLDLQWLGSQSAETFNDFWLAFNRLMVRLSTFPMPTIAAINGHAFAGGALLALSHDHRVMTAGRGWFCLNEVFLQARFSEFLHELIRMKVPVGRALTDIVTLAKRITGPELCEIGVAIASPASEQLLEQSCAIILSLVKQQAYPRGGMGQMKRDLYKVLIEAMVVPYKHLDIPAHI